MAQHLPVAEARKLLRLWGEVRKARAAGDIGSAPGDALRAYDDPPAVSFVICQVETFLAGCNTNAEREAAIRVYVVGGARQWDYRACERLAEGLARNLNRLPPGERSKWLTIAVAACSQVMRGRPRTRQLRANQQKLA